MERIVRFEKKDNQRLFNPVRDAILKYKMIEPGDKVAIGMSGGKDSSTLFYLLHTMKEQNRLGFQDFELHPVALDTTRLMDLTPLKEFCADLGYELEVIPTDIAEIVFDVRQEKNPCSLCANLRRGVLYSTCQERGYNKVALGHHLDDAIETYFMNFLFHGEMASFKPVTYLTKTETTVIRPLLYVHEQNIIHFVEREKNVPVIFNPCPVDKKTKREEIKHLVTHLAKTYPDVREKFVKMMEDEDKAEFWHPLDPKE